MNIKILYNIGCFFELHLIFNVFQSVFRFLICAYSELPHSQEKQEKSKKKRQKSCKNGGFQKCQEKSGNLIKTCF